MKARSATGARTAALAVLAVASLVACVPAERDVPAPGTEDILVGSVVYRERIALPADAVVTVRLEDVSIADAPAAVLAERTIAADGRQVPIPFELRYSRDRIAANRRYGVRAEIRAAGGELMFTTPSHHGVLAGGAAPERDVEIVVERVRAGDEPVRVAPPEVGRTFVYDCTGDVSFTVRTGPGELALWAPESLGGAYTVLAASPAGSTERYEESGTVAVIGGESAAFEIGGQRYADCVSNPAKVPWADAKRRGATFRALGNEPAWNLEIFPDRLVMVTNLGADRAELAHDGAVADGARTTYLAAGERELTAVLERRTCTDAMSGEAFEAAATVTFGGETFRGCGRFL